MKKVICSFSVVLLLFITTETFAQIRFGVKAGLNLATSAGQMQPFEPLKLFHLGGTVEYNFVRRFSLESGLILSEKGNHWNTGFGGFVNGQMDRYDIYNELKPLYLEIPINIKYDIAFDNFTLYLFTGYYVGIGIAGKYTIESSRPVTFPSNYFVGTRDIKYGKTDASDMERIDQGLNFGAGIEFKNLFVSIQHGYGFSNLAHNEAATLEPQRTIHNIVIGISVGYKFGR